MKLKLFIITLIAVSFAVTGLLGGCGGKKNKDSKRDYTIIIDVSNGENTDVKKWNYTTDGDNATGGYDDGANLIWLAVYKEFDNGYLYLDTLYVLSGVAGGNDQIISCAEVFEEEYIDFTATSSKSNIAKLIQSSYRYSTTSYDETGEAKISIKTKDGRKTWFTVIVVDDMNDAPEFI